MPPGTSRVSAPSLQGLYDLGGSAAFGAQASPLVAVEARTPIGAIWRALAQGRAFLPSPFRAKDIVAGAGVQSLLASGSKACENGACENEGAKRQPSSPCTCLSRDSA